jgi:hypothetical protein
VWFLVGLEDGLQINPEALEKIHDAVAFPRAALEAEFVRPAMSGQNHRDHRANVLLRVGAFGTRDQSVSEIVLRPARFERWKKLPAAEANAVFIGDGIAPLRPGNPRRKLSVASSDSTTRRRSILSLAKVPRRPEK